MVVSKWVGEERVVGCGHGNRSVYLGSDGMRWMDKWMALYIVCICTSKDICRAMDERSVYFGLVLDYIWLMGLAFGIEACV